MAPLARTINDTNPNLLFNLYPMQFSQIKVTTADEFDYNQYIIEKKIRTLGNLETGWNYGEGAAPNQEVIEQAIDLSRLGKTYNLSCEVFPVSDGEIEVSLYQDEHFLDILIKKDLTMELTHEVGIGSNYDEKEFIENVSQDKITEKLLDFWEKCNL